MSLGAIILHNTDFTTLMISPCVTSCPMSLTDKHIGKGLLNRLRSESTTPETYKMKFFVALVNGKTR